MVCSLESGSDNDQISTCCLCTSNYMVCRAVTD